MKSAKVLKCAEGVPKETNQYRNAKNYTKVTFCSRKTFFFQPENIYLKTFFCGKKPHIAKKIETGPFLLKLETKNILRIEVPWMKYEKIRYKVEYRSLGYGARMKIILARRDDFALFPTRLL